ncbi:MAG: thiamine phosphate synthase [Bacteroidetes bacterium]|nr:thiamine phosphate synthase [Bacteroidota bacterium]
MIILISNPVPVKDEHEIIHQLFDDGMEIFHLRKKEYPEPELRRFIEHIPEEYLKKTVLHSHYHLATEYGLKGIHVSPAFSGKIPDGTLSVSFHTVDEIRKIGIPFDYGFLSPVFDSISKEGYQSRFSLDEVKQFLEHRKEKIIALGGIEEDKIETVKNLGFSGIALLGAIWQSGHPADKFKRIKERWLK